MRVPVVDLFAGPGGLSEGFSAVRDEKGERVFDIRVSIEKDPVAHRTLSLRALFRSLAEIRVPDSYYDYIRGDISLASFHADPKVKACVSSAADEAHCLELGIEPEQRVDALIREAVKGRDDWVLIGGPPCQAYSMAGRSRRRNVDPTFEDDPKHFLYKEYLRIIRDFQPAIFVMENVKGMLSSTHNGQRIFERIIDDLSEPKPGTLYDIRSFVTDSRPGGLAPDEYVIQAENYGVPQTRHRVILLGVRADYAGAPHHLLSSLESRVTVRDMIGNMPALRSKLSKAADAQDAWCRELKAAASRLKGLQHPKRAQIKALMHEAAVRAQDRIGVGGQFVSGSSKLPRSVPAELAAWIVDARISGVCQHETRGHMATDLHRYLFASSFAEVTGQSPRLRVFPTGFMPEHQNATLENAPFDDRFRVQLFDDSSTTVVSHISKDGHYYIHPDPSQCRSLTVREAARLQTFPDNYFFEGNRTQQYHQVGNAVPPFLAHQLGQSVYRFLARPKMEANRIDTRVDLFSAYA
ncbi:DNA methyltransferase [Caballeronia pedi]|uniref:DNA (cytosine-5-)-methyltransferase n=1 Tax=Caballeronia pedi TaxID=1777141 RepID=A0A158A1M4_9BURK|nr:DNA cytosine methyltransferase [Caballeronia pedi]SAK51670.1 DNA methyltransferase [Caballeronia pedi]